MIYDLQIWLKLRQPIEFNYITNGTKVLKYVIYSKLDDVVRIGLESDFFQWEMPKI